MKSSFISRVATTIALVFGAFALSVLAAGTWTAPTVPPPGGNPDAPVNVGPTTQTKLGWLGVKGLVATDFTLATGTPAAGKVLTAIDSLGNAGWVTPAVGSSVFDFSLAGQSQSINITATPVDITIANAGSAKAAIINFTKMGGCANSDTVVGVSKINSDDSLTSIGGTGAGASSGSVDRFGGTIITPLRNGKFSAYDLNGGSCNGITMRLIGLIN